MKFSVMIADHPQNAKVHAEIYCGPKFVAAVSQELGPERLQLELPGCDLNEEMIQRSVNLEGFLEAARVAVRQLAGEPLAGE